MRVSPVLTLLLLAASASPALAQWTKMGPGAGGAFTSIAAGPTGIVLCGSDIGGLYRSLDGGARWDGIGIDRGVPLTHISAVGFHPADASLLFCGGNAGKSGPKSRAPWYRSVDAGATWTAGKPAVGGYVSAFGTTARDTQYCAWAASFNDRDQQVWRSVDRGASWSRVSATALTGKRIVKLLVHPANARRLVLLSGDDGNLTGAKEMWKSNDGGANWRWIGSALGEVLDVAWNPSKPETLVATSDAAHNLIDGFVWRSLDGGETWNKGPSMTGAIAWKAGSDTVRVINVERNITPTGKACGTFESGDAGASWKRKATGTDWDAGWVKELGPAYGRGSYGIGKTLGQSIQNPNEIWWVTSRFLWKSSDGGLRFECVFANQRAPGGQWLTRGIDNINIFALAASERKPGTLFAGYYDIGLWRSLDAGASWRMLNDSVATGTWKGRGGNCSSIVLDPDRPGMVWVTNGVKRSQQRLIRSESLGDLGTWTQATGLVDDRFMYGLSLDRTSPATRRTLFVTADGDVYKSNDDGRSFARVLDCQSCFVTAVDHFDGKLVYAGGPDGLYVSTNGGQTWSRPIDNGGAFSGAVPKPDNVGEAQWTGIHAIVPDPVARDKVYVVAYSTGGDKKGLWVCTNPRASKPAFTRKAARLFARGLAIDPRDPRRAYLTTSPAANSGKSNIDTTTTFGIETTANIDAPTPAWTSLNRGKQWPFAWPVVVDPFDSSVVYVGEPGNGALKLRLPATVVGVGRGPAR
ncbi:MAG: hypothetical protein E6K78_10425 [Candidatus Eisenbacteria bacterium]|uniref:Sortilin N-terminal domain-containing protein n=1 Tax=Eiseniibacteriota bacterium TaxID=2212470 RepID=A0A538TJ24_UNCEI|nr:MAG: hypothetical protein E6K78_10425 [Candidatus Eisenbacteria bacterium]